MHLIHLKFFMSMFSFISLMHLLCNSSSPLSQNTNTSPSFYAFQQIPHLFKSIFFSYSLGFLKLLIFTIFRQWLMNSLSSCIINIINIKIKKHGTNLLSIIDHDGILRCHLLIRLLLYPFSINSAVIYPSFINFINPWLSYFNVDFFGCGFF